MTRAHVESAALSHDDQPPRPGRLALGLAALLAVMFVSTACTDSTTDKPATSQLVSAGQSSEDAATQRQADEDRAAATAAAEQAAKDRAVAEAAAASAAADKAAAQKAAADAAAAKAAADKAAAQKAAEQRAAAAKAAADTAAAAQALAPSQENCTAAYPDFCIPQRAGDAYNCSDFSQKRFTARPEDPYGLDRDHDGVACES